LPYKLGQTDLHTKLGFDHHNSADLQVNPDSKEGQALLDYLRTNNIPFRASRGRETNSKGKLISTGVHVHLGLLSHGLGKSSNSNVDLSGIDLSDIDVNDLDLSGVDLGSDTTTTTTIQNTKGIDLSNLDLDEADIHSNANLKTEIPLDYEDTNLVTKDKFKPVEGPSPLALAGLPVYGGYKAISGLIDVMKNNPEELANITELVKAGKAAVIKNKNPDRLLKPARIQVGGFKKEVPDTDSIIESYLFNIDPELVAANRKYKQETGRNLINFTGTPVYTYQDGVYNFDIQLTGSAARQLNAYARGGMSEWKKETSKIGNEREAYVNELGEIDKGVKDRIGNRDWLRAVSLLPGGQVPGLLINQFTTPNEREQFVRNVEDKFVLGNLQLLHNVEMLGRAIDIGATKGMDSEDYLNLIKEDRKRQYFLNQANELLPKPKTLTENVFAAFGGAIADTPKMLLASRGLPLLVYLEHLQEGNPKAAAQAFSMLPMIGAGHLFGELTAENVRLANYSLASRVIRQLEVRGIQGGAMAATDIVMNPEEYLNGSKTLAQAIDNYKNGKLTVKDILSKTIERGLPTAAVGAAFPVGGVGKDLTRSFIKPNRDFYRDDVIIGPLKKDYQGYGPEASGESSPYTPSSQVKLGNSGQPVIASNLDPELLATRHNVGRGVVERLLGYAPDNLLVYRQALLKNIESFEKRTNFSGTTPEVIPSFKNESDINLKNKQLLPLVDDILNQYKNTSDQAVANVPINMLAYNLYKMKQALANKTYLKEGLSVAERVTRENNLKMSIKLLDEALPDDVKNINDNNIQAIEMALTGRDKNKAAKDKFRGDKARVDTTTNKAKDKDLNISIPDTPEKADLLELQKAIANTYNVNPSDPHWGKAELAFNAKERLTSKVGGLLDKLKSQKGSVDITGKGGIEVGPGSVTRLGADIVNDLTKIATFHIEDFYRKQIEPTLERFIDRLRSDLGEKFVNILKPSQIQDLYNRGQKYYETNNADPFFSSFKQNVLEQFPNSLKAESAKSLIQKLGTKQELDWTTGLDEWVDNKVKNNEKVNKNDLIDYIEKNQVKVDEVVLGDYINTEDDATYKTLKDELGSVLRDKYDADKNKSRTQEEFDAIERQQRFIELRISNREREIEEHNRTVGFTKYDLKTYTSERLELEGGENPREVLLRTPRKTGVPSLGFAAFLDSKFGYNVEDFKSLSRFEQKNLEQAYRASGNSGDLYIEGSHGEVYQSDHWSQGNVVAHFRANFRKLADGITKVFHSEEFQSDWNQAGRKEGYKNPNKYYTFNTFTGEELGRYKTEIEAKEASNKIPNSSFSSDELTTGYKDNLVPQNPFMENSWKELAFKRFLRMAIENNADGVTWTTARQQQERYKKIVETKDIKYYKNKEGRYDIYYKDKEGEFKDIPDGKGRNITIGEVRSLIGNEFADKILEGRVNNTAKTDFEAVKTPARTHALMNKITKEWLTHHDVKGNGDDTPITFTDPIQAENYKLGVEFNSGIVYGKEITIGNKFTDYDNYFVNLAKKIGKKFGAEYKIKDIPVGDVGSNVVKSLNTDDDTYSFFINGKPISDSLGQPLKVHHVIAEDTRNLINSEILKNPGKLYILFNPDGTGGLIPTSKLGAVESFMKTAPHLDYVEMDVPPAQKKTESVHYLEITPKMRDSILKEGQPLYGVSDTNKPSPKLEIGIRNKIITRNAWDSARANVVEVIHNTSTDNGIVFNTGLNPEAFVDQVKLLYKGIKDFTEFSKLAIQQFGDWIEPHLSALWDLTNKKLRDFNENEAGSWMLWNNKAPSTAQFYRDKTFSKVPKDILRKSLNSIALAQLNPNTYGKVYDVIRDVEGITNTRANYIIGQLKDAAVLDEKLRPDVAEVIYIGNETNKVYTDAELLAGDPTVNRPPLNAEQVQAYKSIREAQNKILDIRLAHELHYAYKDLSRAVPGTPEYGGIINRIKRINDHYTDLKNEGYTTLKRNGNIVIEAEDLNYPVGDPKRRHYTHARNRKEAMKIEQEYIGKGLANIKVDDLKTDTTNLRHLSVGMTPSAFEELVIRSGANTNDPHVQQLREKVYSRYNTHSYKIKRDYVPGYQRTWENLVHSMDTQMRIYERSYFTNMGRELGMDALNSTTLMKDDYGLYKLSKSYIEDATTPYAEHSYFGQRLFTKARQATSWLQLAYDNAQFWMNGYAQPVSQTYSYFARMPEMTGADPETYFLKGGKLSHQTLLEHYGQKKTIFNNDPVFTNLVNRGFTENLLTARMTNELIKDYEGGIGNKLISNGFIFNRGGEIVTRLHAFSEAYLVGTEKLSLSGEDLYKFMRRAVDATQGVGGTGENPFYVRKAGEFGKLIYQFQKFNMMWWENLGMAIKTDMDNIGIPSKATGRHLAGLALSGGIAGLPLTAFAKTIYTVVTGKDPKEEFKKYMKDHELLENLALYGLPSIPAYFLGTSAEGLSRKIGITFPFLDSVDEYLYGSDSVIDRAAKSVPVISTAAQMSNVVGDTKKAIQTKRISDALVAGEDILPKALKNIARGTRYGIDNYQNKSINDRSGNIIVPTDRLSNADVIGQVLGITPAKVTDYYETKKYKAIGESEFTKKVRKYEKRIGLNF
jgi:hypothetical protein